MITIPRADSVHPLKLGDLTFNFSPLLVWAEVDIMSVYRRKEGDFEVNAALVAYKTIKHCLKSVEGDVEYSDGSKFELKFASDGSLSDQSVTEVLSLPIKQKLLEHSFKIINDHFALSGKVDGAKKRVEDKPVAKKKKTKNN